MRGTISTCSSCATGAMTSRRSKLRRAALQCFRQENRPGRRALLRAPRPAAVNMTGPIFDDYDVRQRAYFSTLAGSMGHVYGNANVWHFEDPNDNLQGKWTKKIVHWKQDMDSKGSFQMTHVKNLWESRSLAGRMPANISLPSPSAAPASWWPYRARAMPWSTPPLATISASSWAACNSRKRNAGGTIPGRQGRVDQDDCIQRQRDLLTRLVMRSERMTGCS